MAWEPPGARIPVRAHTRGSQAAAPAWEPPGSREPSIPELKARGAEQSARLEQDIEGGIGMLPAVGGAVGLGVGGIPGATLGGAGGEAVRQLIQRARGKATPATPREAIRAIEHAMLTQGGLAAGGEALTGGAQLAARGTMGAALRMAPTLRRGFKGVAEEALQGGVIPGRLLGGARKAEQLRKASSAAEEMITEHAGQQGLMVDARTLAQPALDLAASRVGTLTPAAEATIIRRTQAIADQALKEHTLGAYQAGSGQYTPSQVRVIKQYAQDASAPIYDKALKATLSRAQAGRAAHATLLAQSSRDYLTNMITPAGEDLGAEMAAQMAKTQRLIGLKRGVVGSERGGGMGGRLAYHTGSAAIGATMGLAQPAGSGQQRAMHGLEGALIGQTALSPTALGILAHGLNSPIARLLLLYGPQLAGPALQAHQ